LNECEVGCTGFQGVFLFDVYIKKKPFGHLAEQGCTCNSFFEKSAQNMPEMHFLSLPRIGSEIFWSFVLEAFRLGLLAVGGCPGFR
jgi:hypothetical protein